MPRRRNTFLALAVWLASVRQARVGDAWAGGAQAAPRLKLPSATGGPTRSADAAPRTGRVARLATRFLRPDARGLAPTAPGKLEASRCGVPLGSWVLVTGGAGYIGSHTVLELVEAGYNVTVVDNLVNSDKEAIRRVKEITGKQQNIEFVHVDVTNKADIEKVFKKRQYSCVIHFAALKAVGESVRKPVEYYENNLLSTTVLLAAMAKHNCTNFVFSSSATVYGDAPIPYTEASEVGRGVTSPYGQTKVMIEQILKDVVHAPESPWKVVVLRYFNPIGAHPSGRIGEDPSGIPNNLMPFIAQVCVGRRDYLTVFGDDFDTADGTCLRDYIHVVDLAKGHVAAMKRFGQDEPFWEAYNLGSGAPVSVLEMVAAMGKAVGKAVPYKIGARRPGDLPAFWASAQKARDDLGWQTERTLDDMCADTWRWQSQNPNGYAKRRRRR